MPFDNNFQHQKYSCESPLAPYRVVKPENAFDIHSLHSRQIMSNFADRLRDRSIRSVYLVHGTFAGTDVLGVIRELERWVPSMGKILREHQKKFVDMFAGEAGNFSQAYAERFSEMINANGQIELPVRLFHWTGENLHLARANAAVRLLEEMLSDTESEPARYLLWGHSHAGNVFALLTNLLGGDRACLRRFFAVGRSLLKRSASGVLDYPVWKRVRRQVLADPSCLNRIELDIVTFGTPIRYGWETRGYQSLMNVIHHRSMEGVPEYLALFPTTLTDVIQARNGDYIQQLGVAGTNLTPYLPAWRSWMAERRFRSLLEQGIRRRDTLDRLRIGQRVPAEGTTILVEYPNDPNRLSEQLFGHAVYTRSDWLAFHAQQLDVFWSTSSSQADLDE
ncbi:MAG: hypothetical protein P8N76_03365 [Pirellulaceae bacterium]|nr:hypothetical protein [Pirellulaceae bacterium]